MPTSPIPTSADAFFQLITSGNYDAAFNGVFAAFANAGYTSFYIRPGYEMNNVAKIWNIGNSPSTAAHFVSAFQRIAFLAHTFPAASIKVIWNPLVGAGLTVPYLSYYPGDASVDVIGIDVFAGSGREQPTLQSADPTNYTLLAACALAKTRNKPIALPEVRINAGAPAPVWTTNYITSLAAVVLGAGVNIEFIGLWDYTSNGAISWSNSADNQPDIITAFAASFSASRNPPTPATDLTTTTITPTSFVLSWTPPSSGNLPFTYQLLWRLATSTDAWTPVATSLTHATASNLLPSTSYVFRVLTRNDSGTSISSIVLFSTPAIQGFAGAVSGSQVSGATDPVISGPSSAYVPVGSSLLLTGVSVSDSLVSGLFALRAQSTFGTITMSQGIDVVPGSGTQAIIFNGTQTELNTVLATLTFGTPAGSGSDNLTLQVTDPNGRSNTLVIPISVPDPAGQPTAPSNVLATLPTSTSVTITWTASAGLAPITYTVQYRPSGNGSWTTSGTTQSTTFTVTGLQPLTAYDFQVGAANSVNNSASAIITSATANAAVLAPSAIPSLQVGTITGNAVPLVWTPPTQGSAVVYTVQYRLSSPTPPAFTAYTSTTATSATVAGLAYSTTYNFQITATNSAGQNVSPISSATTGANPNG
jgi:chitodextrinase